MASSPKGEGSQPPELYKISEAALKSIMRGENYGILNSDDIGLYAWKNDDGEEFGLESMGPFWICFAKKSITRLRCREFGPDPADFNNNNSELEFVVKEKNQVHFIVGRRAWLYSVCKSRVTTWKKYMKGESHFCIAGEHWTIKENNNPNEHHWTYDRFKTKKGCTSLFEETCDFDGWRKWGYPNRRYDPDYRGDESRK